MSMSEFEREMNGWEDDSSCLSMQERALPADFSLEDVAFAQELEALFSISEEETPPYFVQTLLEPETRAFRWLSMGLSTRYRLVSSADSISSVVFFIPNDHLFAG